jgi:hypothetical protein
MESAPLRVMEFKVSGSENDLFRSMLMKCKRPFRSLKFEVIKVNNEIKNKSFAIFIIIKFVKNDYILIINTGYRLPKTAFI